MSTCASPVIVALDYPEAEAARSLARRLDPLACRLKVGKELFTAAGPGLLEDLHKLGFELFLDLKFHDIPNTVAAALRSAAQLGVWMANVHASGGRRMLEAAASAVSGFERPPLLIGVTVLTSIAADEFDELGFRRSLEEQVEHLSRLTADCGLDGVVCSAREASRLRACLGERFLLVTPGIRPAGSSANDQRRVVTPQQALADGSSFLVIGRPITAAEDPAAALAAINRDIAQLR
ncbi:MAG: orotidine-5'-phosphate decarboxylase [Halieaceae bacterium]|jgi:orotidine-5'-phosphate decarboxylase|nr:orotidine-5'-phosphate decarboxylase [Halieaceae bacterium]